MKRINLKNVKIIAIFKFLCDFIFKNVINLTLYLESVPFQNKIWQEKIFKRSLNPLFYQINLVFTKLCSSNTYSLFH